MLDTIFMVNYSFPIFSRESLQLASLLIPNVAGQLGQGDFNNRKEWTLVMKDEKIKRGKLDNQITADTIH